eukprot:TRINITY_DN4485_c0_g1_i6.p1 TRINITY_DN4485_c0_g1~~TRINITY_DN4485_c0_g1_i6.p1  ORF type:complete len:809 (-),score=188.05 TRINITY_DN4485_c0_g1_i6:612-3038(-)
MINNQSVTLAVQGSSAASSNCVLNQIVQSVYVAKSVVPAQLANSVASYAVKNSANTLNAIGLSSVGSSSSGGFTVHYNYSDVISVNVSVGTPQVVLTQFTSDTSNFASIGVNALIPMNSSFPLSMQGPNLNLQVFGILNGVSRSIMDVQVNVSIDTSVSHTAGAAIHMNIPADVLKPLIQELTNTSSHLFSSLSVNISSNMQDLISTIASQVVKNVNVSQLMSSNLGQGLLTSVISNVGNISLTSMDPTNNLGAGQTTILLAIPVNDIVVSSISPVLGLIDHAQIIIPAISASMGYISSSGSVNTAAASMQAQRAQITVWLGAAASAVQTSMVQLNLTMTDTTAATQLSSSLMGILFGSQLATVTLRSTAASEFVFNFALQGTTVVATSNVLSLDLSALGKAQENGLVTFVSAFANVSSNGQTFVQPCNFLPGVLCPTSVSYTPYTYATNPAITNVLLPLKLRLNSGPVAFPASLQFPNIYINLSATPLVFDTSIFDLGPVLYVGASAVAISTTIDPISGQFLLNIVMDANLKFRQDGISNLISSFNLNSVVVQAIENGVNLSTISVNLVGSQKVNILSSMASSLTARAIVNSTEFLNNFRYLVIDATVPRSAAGELLVNLAVTTTEGTALPNLMFGMFALQVSSQGSAFLQTTSPNLNISSGLIDVQFDLTFSNPTTINTFIKSLLLSAKSGNTAPMEVSLSGPVGFYLPMEISVNGAFNWLFGIITRSNLFADILYNSDTNAANPTSIGAAVDGLFSSAFAYGCPASHLRVILLESQRFSYLEHSSDQQGVCSDQRDWKQCSNRAG